MGVDIAAAGGDTSILDYLAEVQLSQGGDIAVAVDTVRHSADGGLIIGVLGTLDVPEAQLLGALRRSGTTCVGFMINSSTWTNLPTTAREEAETSYAAAGLALLQGGWRAIDVGHGAKLETLWPQVARGSQGFAWRAAMAETVAGGVR